MKFRNASQDERLSIITRMNLLELIELRAKGWQVSDGLNTYYKHKVSDIQVGPTLTFIAIPHTQFKQIEMKKKSIFYLLYTSQKMLLHRLCCKIFRR